MKVLPIYVRTQNCFNCSSIVQTYECDNRSHVYFYTSQTFFANLGSKNSLLLSSWSCFPTFRKILYNNFCSCSQVAVFCNLWLEEAIEVQNVAKHAGGDRCATEGMEILMCICCLFKGRWCRIGLLDVVNGQWWMLIYPSVLSTWCVARRSEGLVDVWRKEFPAVKEMERLVDVCERVEYRTRNQFDLRGYWINSVFWGGFVNFIQTLSNSIDFSRRCSQHLCEQEWFPALHWRMPLGYNISR